MSKEPLRWVRSPKDLSGVPDGKPVRVRVAGEDLCLVRQGGQWHAFLDRCPHQGASFVGGWCEDHHLVCPRHRMAFDLATGLGRNGKDRAHVFAVQERAGAIYIAMPRKGPKIFGFRLW